MTYPYHRPRRLRRLENLRRLVRETELAVKDLLWPLFVVEGERVRQPVESMPGVFRYSVDQLLGELEEAVELGLPGVLLFGVTDRKDPQGSEAWNREGVVPRAIRAIKARFPELVVAADVCLCPYTDHGHCGVVEEGRVLNDPTLPLLARAAVTYAEAGADLVAPSDMMDGRVRAIREALDAAGFQEVGIMAYSAKYASAFYGPFREAAESAPRFGDRRSYQMDPANAAEALWEVELDLEEGADIVMVKPALAYLDVIRQVKDAFGRPVAAYNVSGEYAMIKAAAKLGWLDEKAVVLEVLTAIKRAGADIIITYFAKEAARWLRR
ncbi:Porphobilinogen synthase [Ammonifex degensii KC4]|uniref:Delta-aminolevulinic acid dehydratase n=1 Tax=Ammonifex degensii (strain DSM 10501 / KC4) TaxID=429009 RepID=C9R7T8_AMMDK|nr:porphobilinogen synthase [Ammonifex degensii]ACX52367.1 Porphobilinogen synthase [Ammonifex degensii KC4]